MYFEGKRWRSGDNEGKGRRGDAHRVIERLAEAMCFVEDAPVERDAEGDLVRGGPVLGVPIDRLVGRDVSPAEVCLVVGLAMLELVNRSLP